MKYLVTILFFFISITVFSQQIFPYLGSPTTKTLNRGYFQSDSGSVVSYNFTDTTSANRGIIKNIPNIVINVNDTLWKRSNSAQYWTKIGSGVGGSQPNIADSLQNTVIIYSRNNFTNDFFHGSDAALTFPNGDISFSSTSDKALNFALKAPNGTDTFFHTYERWEVVATVQVDTLAINDDGFFIGDSAADGLYGLHVKGHGSIGNYAIGYPVASGADLSPVSGSGAFNRGDILIVSAKRDRGTLIVSMNKLGQTPVVWQIPIGQAGTSYTPPTIKGQFNIRLYQGQFSIKNLVVKFNDANADVAFVGNSITVGGKASPIYDSGWVQTLRKSVPNVTIMAASSAMTSDVVKCLPAIVAGLPKKVSILIGTNDFTNGIATGVTQANYVKIVDTLLAHGITPIITSILPRNDFDVRSFNNWLQSTFPYLYIDFFSGMANSGTYTMKSVYNSGDGIHPNNVGHYFMADTFLQQYSRSGYIIDQNRTLAFNGKGQFNNLRLNNLVLTNIIGDTTNYKVLVADSMGRFATAYLGNIGGFQNPMSVLGDIIYGGASGLPTRLAGNTLNQRQFLISQGTSVIAQAPTWGLLQANDIPIPQGQIGVGGGGGFGTTNALSSTSNFVWDNANTAVEVNLSSSSQPSFAFVGQTNSGLGHISANLELFESGNIGAVLTSSTTSFRLPSSWEYSWSSATNNLSASDVGISRTAAGKIAVGNGTTGNTTGTLILGSIGVGGPTSPVTTSEFAGSFSKDGEGAITSASGAIANSDTKILSSDVVMAANRLVAGTVIEIILHGTCTSTAGGVGTVNVRYGTAGTTADGLLEAFTLGAAQTSGTTIPFTMRILITIRTTGGSATADGELDLINQGTTGISTTATEVIRGANTTINTATASTFLTVSYISGNASTASTFQDAVIKISYK